MGLPGTVDTSVYEGLKDVLQRHPFITTVSYEPDSIVKRFLQAEIDPNRVTVDRPGFTNTSMLNGGLSRKNRIIAFTTPIRIRDSIVRHRDDDHPSSTSGTLPI